MFDAILAYAHFITLLSAFALLVAELAVFHAASGPGKWRLLSRLDLGYFLSAIGVLVTGLGRVFLGFKGAAYYWHNPWFHALWITFLLIAILSITPTLLFMKWAKVARTAPEFTPQPQELRHVRNHLQFEILLFCIAPMFAVLMARGFGA